MNEFNLKSKFEKIINNLGIKKEDAFNFNIYEEHINRCDICIINKDSFNFTLSKLTDSLNKIIDLIFLLNYIENNYKNFTYKQNKTYSNKLRTKGFDYSDLKNIKFNELNAKTSKDVIFHIYKDEKFSSNKYLFINFSLLDKKYNFLNKDIYNYNLTSLINAIDKYDFFWHNIDIKKQVDERDELFAIVNIKAKYEDLFENAINWITLTGWYNFYEDIQLKLQEFCKNSNLQYHYSYNNSINKINISIKNINFEVTEKFLSIYDIYTSFRNELTNHNIVKTNINEIRENYKNVYGYTYSLLQDKVFCLKDLIYLNKKL